MPNPNPKYDHLMKHCWKPGDVPNPNGRPRKSTRVIIEQLQEKGITWVRPTDVKDIYERLLDSDEETLKKLVNDSEQPMIVRIASKQLLSNRGWEIAKDMLVRAHGNPNQKHELETTSVNVSLDDYLTEEQKRAIALNYVSKQ